MQEIKRFKCKESLSNKKETYWCIKGIEKIMKKLKAKHKVYNIEIVNSI